MKANSSLMVNRPRSWALIVSLVLFAAAGLYVVRSPRTTPTSYWVFGWIVGAAAGSLLLLQDELPLVRFLSYALGPLFAALMLAGALSLAERAVPPWLVPAALVLGALRLALAGADLT